MKQSVTVAIIALFTLFTTQAWPHPGSGIVVDQEGQIYFVLSGAPHNRIMKIDAQGKVASFVVDKRLRAPHHLVIDKQGNLYTVSDNDSIVWKITPTGSMTRFYAPNKRNEIGSISTWGDPFTIDRAGHIYYIDYPGRRQILKISKGKVHTLAGNEAGFSNLHSSSMAWGPDGVLYVTDRSRIQKVAADGTVSTLYITQGPGLGVAMGLAVDGQGHVYVADYGKGQVLKITSEGKASKLIPSEKDGSLHKAAGAEKPFKPTGVAIGLKGDLYVLDNPGWTTRVWKISTEGTVEMLTSIDIRDIISSDK